MFDYFHVPHTTLMQRELAKISESARLMMMANRLGYHNNKHVDHMLSLLDDVYADNHLSYSEVVTKLELVAAITFHDVIYIPMAGQNIGVPSINETMSALFWLAQARKSLTYKRNASGNTVREWLEVDNKGWFHSDDPLKSVEKLDIVKVSLLIQETTIEHHRAETSRCISNDILLDLDLASLAGDYKRFVVSQQGVMSEYITPGQNKLDVLIAQAKFLKTLADKKSIYRTDYGKRNWEHQARSNINRLYTEVAL